MFQLLAHFMQRNRLKQTVIISGRLKNSYCYKNTFNLLFLILNLKGDRTWIALSARTAMNLTIAYLIVVDINLSYNTQIKPDHFPISKVHGLSTLFKVYVHIHINTVNIFYVYVHISNMYMHTWWLLNWHIHRATNNTFLLSGMEKKKERKYIYNKKITT